MFCLSWQKKKNHIIVSLFFCLLYLNRYSPPVFTKNHLHFFLEMPSYPSPFTSLSHSYSLTSHPTSPHSMSPSLRPSPPMSHLHRRTNTTGATLTHHHHSRPPPHCSGQPLMECGQSLNFFCRHQGTVLNCFFVSSMEKTKKQFVFSVE